MACSSGGGGSCRIEGMRFQSMGKMEKDFCQKFLQPLLENVAGSLFQSFATLTKKANRLLRRWLVPCGGHPLRPDEWEGEKTSSDQHPLFTLPMFHEDLLRLSSVDLITRNYETRGLQRSGHKVTSSSSSGKGKKPLRITYLWKSGCVWFDNHHTCLDPQTPPNP